MWRTGHDTIVFLTYYRVNHLYLLWEMSQHLASQEPFDKHSGILPFGVTVFKRMSLNNNQFSLVTQSCPTLCNPMDRSIPDFPVHHQFLELALTHVHWVGDAIQPSHPLSSRSPPTFNCSQHQGVYQWASSSHQVFRVLKFQHQSFQWTFRVGFL